MSDFIMLVNVKLQTPSLGKLFLNCYINIKIIRIDIYLLQEQHMSICPHGHTHTHKLMFLTFLRSQEYMLQELLIYTKPTYAVARCLVQDVFTGRTLLSC